MKGDISIYLKVIWAKPYYKRRNFIFFIIWVIIFNFRKQLDEREQRSLTIMQMVVVAVFVICNILAMVSNILEMMNLDGFYIITVSNLLVTINSSVNLLIYSTFGLTFRNELKRIFSITMAKVSYTCKTKTAPNTRSFCYTSSSGSSLKGRSKSLPDVARGFSSHSDWSENLPLATFEVSSFLLDNNCFEITNIETQSMSGGI